MKPSIHDKHPDGKACPHPNPGHRSGFPPATVKLVATDLVIFLEVPEFLGFSGTMQVEPIH